MKKSQYPITIGVPSVAVIGVSRAGKSSLLSRLIHNHVSANLNTVGTEQGQTTLIPTDYFLRSDNDSPDAVRLRVTSASSATERPSWIVTPFSPLSAIRCLPTPTEKRIMPRACRSWPWRST